MTRAKVLLAADDVTMISLLTTLLKMEGFQVVALLADEDIPAAVRRESPDVLLMDVHLLHQSGHVVEKIRKTEDISRTRIVMSSGANVREECINRGANDFLLKPYMPDELITILKNTINAAQP